MFGRQRYYILSVCQTIVEDYNIGMRVLLNDPPRADRGEVIETSALLDALETGKINDAAIDTWEK